jgi:hypothetical protein
LINLSLYDENEIPLPPSHQHQALLLRRTMPETEKNQFRRAGAEQEQERMDWHTQ